MSEFLEVYGAKTHNLKDISIKIPKNKLVVITGVSGSGKSSLAFDTIYAEGQRRYLESLSTYARMIISGISEETKVDDIKGLSPTISINQKTVSSNPRSTVGTITEIYDFFRLLYVTIGIQKCPNHPEIILKKDTLESILNHIISLKEGTKFLILSPILKNRKISSADEVKKEILELGFIRFMIDGQVFSIGDEVNVEIKEKSKIFIVVDRLIANEIKDNENTRKRIKDSLEIAYKNGGNILEILDLDKNEFRAFSKEAFCPKCHYSLQDITISNFSFNSHYGACPTCHGLGMQVAFLEENIINQKLSLNEGAILPWSQHKYYTTILNAVCKKYKIDCDKPYMKLTKEEKQIVLNGADFIFEIPFSFENGEEKTFKTKYEGIVPNLVRKYKESNMGDEMSLKRISQYMTEIECVECEGHRLKKEYLNIFINDRHIGELANMDVRKLIDFFARLDITETERKISRNILKNICERLDFLSGVGLNYITVSRRANTLSGGESQRIRLATQIGTRLEGIIYVLDEPSIGLHPRDNNMLIKNLKKLSEIGNTVIVVEHDEDVMRESDYIIDIGPGAGIHGGEVVFEGTFEEILKDKKSDTGAYLSNRKTVKSIKKERKPSGFIEIIGASENNLKNVSVKIPLGLLNVVTGVSGSGKSSLILDILSNHLLNSFLRSKHHVGKVKEIKGVETLDKVIIIDQSPIGKTPHSNVATYTGVFTYIREVFAQTQEALKRGFGPGRFSFNTKGGRCEICEGSGVKKIEMHFLPDVYVECENCHGSRYNSETLEIRYKGKTISEVLNMDVEEACDFFAAHPRIARILDVLNSVGLGYIKIGQSAPTLSGGESQRIKLSSELAKRSTSKTIYILDEPTTGLHFSDVQKLLNILEGLVNKGNTVLVIEHNLDLIANADHIIDIGPEGGDKGGELIFDGKLKDILKVERSYTGQALKTYFKNKDIIL
ncbi:MAG: excinuclease ABC subunit UvrA [Candidatus Gracilibacteria bacterium]|nr:excinuclease ABC subunit UvrA [Candidatus Gracilibacteria bacterium]